MFFMLLVVGVAAGTNPCGELANWEKKRVDASREFQLAAGAGTSLCELTELCKDLQWIKPVTRPVTCAEAQAVLEDKKANRHTICDPPLDIMEARMMALPAPGDPNKVLVPRNLASDKFDFPASDWLREFATYKILQLPVIPGVTAAGVLAGSSSAAPWFGRPPLSAKSLLEMGVRFFELELKRVAWVGKGEFVLVSGARLSDVMKDVTDFLEAHQTEFVIVSLRIGSAGHFTFEQLFKSFPRKILFAFESAAHGKLDTLAKATVEEAAGKILLILDHTLSKYVQESVLGWRLFLDAKTSLSLCSNKPAGSLEGALALLDLCVEKYVPLKDWERFRGVKVDWKSSSWFSGKSQDSKHMAHFWSKWDGPWRAVRLFPLGLVVFDAIEPEGMKKLMEYAKLYRYSANLRTTLGLDPLPIRSRVVLN